MWTLRALISHPGLEPFPHTARSLFDLAALLSDSISDDVRRQLTHRDGAKPMDDDRSAFIFGSIPPPDGWLSLTLPMNPASNGQTESFPQAQPQPLNTSPAQQPGQQVAGPGGIQRSLSQQHVPPSGQSPGQTRTFSHYSQPSKMLPQQLQRMASNGQGGPSTPLHQMQQMQSLAQQRNMQPSFGQQQRTAVPPNQPFTAGTGRAATNKQDKAETRHVPFALNRWEVLPECGSNTLGNETAISLSLFGARKV